jgi:murein DD-endopeptidase MepM/ murein hydrolase activator NlpD
MIACDPHEVRAKARALDVLAAIDTAHQRALSEIVDVRPRDLVDEEPIHQRHVTPRQLVPRSRIPLLPRLEQRTIFGHAHAPRSVSQRAGPLAVSGVEPAFGCHTLSYASRGFAFDWGGATSDPCASMLASSPGGTNYKGVSVGYDGHDGMDWPMPKNRSIKAVQKGIVLVAGFDPWAWRAINAGAGALSIDLWASGQRPDRD